MKAKLITLFSFLLLFTECHHTSQEEIQRTHQKVRILVNLSPELANESALILSSEHITEPLRKTLEVYNILFNAICF